MCQASEAESRMLHRNERDEIRAELQKVIDGDVKPTKEEGANLMARHLMNREALGYG